MCRVSSPTTISNKVLETILWNAWLNLGQQKSHAEIYGNHMDIENLHQKNIGEFSEPRFRQMCNFSTWKKCPSPSCPTLLKVKQAAVELLQKDGHLKVAKRVFVGGYGNPCRIRLKVAIPLIFFCFSSQQLLLLMEGNPAAL